MWFFSLPTLCAPALPREKGRMRKGAGLGWKSVSVTLMTDLASAQATPADANRGFQPSLRSTAELIWARGNNDDLS